MKHMIKTVHSDQKGIAIILLSAGTGDRISKKGTRSLYKIGDGRLTANGPRRLSYGMNLKMGTPRDVIP